MEFVLTDKGKSYDKRLRKKLWETPFQFNRPGAPTTPYKTTEEFRKDLDISMVLNEVDENMLAFPHDPEGLDSSGESWSGSLEVTPEQLAYGEKESEEFSSWADLESKISPKTKQILRGLFEAGYIKVIGNQS